MITGDMSRWCVVQGTLRSATLGSEGLDAGPAAALRQIPFLGLLWLLIELIRGHRATFMYTYFAEGKYHVGRTHRYVRRKDDFPRLFGRGQGEALYVRYKPEAPAVSVVLAEDNPS